MSSVNNSSCLIVGAGAIGLSLAWQLSKRGQSVTVIESLDEQHRSASWAGAGILPPVATKNVDDPYDQLRALSHQLHPQWADELRAATGIDNGFRICGGIYLGTSRAEIATLVANQFWWEEHGIEYEQIGIDQLCEIEPNLTSLKSRDLIRAWRLPGECQLRNPDHLKALRVACQQRKVTFVQCTIQKIEISSDEECQLVDDQGRCHDAKSICLCSGAWTRLLMEHLKLSNGIMPVRGQMLLYKSERPLLSHIVNDGNRYFVAREDGHLLVGSVEEEAGYVCSTTAESLSLIRQWGESTMPILRELPVIKSWAGLRPGSYDGFPYMGLAPGTRNLFIAAGHYRSGLHLSCGTAVLMANLMLGLPTSMDLAPFRVSRG